MRNIILVLSLLMVINFCHANETNKPLKLSCQSFSWSDVESLVQPYLDDSLYTALVMQGQSSNYKTSEAAAQAMDETLPDAIKIILRSIIKSDCD